MNSEKEFIENFQSNVEKTETQAVIVKGIDLTQEELTIINNARVKEFGSSTLIKPEKENEDGEQTFFLIRNENNLSAFGRLRNVDVVFQDGIYHILGVANIIALEKGKGYGKKLMDTMKEYIEQSGQTAIGFCDKKNSPFYIKCGFGIIPDGQKQFIHSTPSRFKEGDVLYLSGHDGLIDKIKEDPEATASISIPHW